jgi:epothilone polyketide synthase D
VDTKPGLLPPSASPDPRGRRLARRRSGVPVSQAARPVFLFSGLGAEHPEMGRGLFRMSSTFRSELERCDRLYRELTGSALLVQRHPPFGHRIRNGRPSYVQPAVFAFQYALAAAWIAWGVRPAAVLGYSLGEDAAACVAGAASLEDVMTMIVNRARTMDGLRGGGMAVLFAGPDHVRALLARQPRVEIAATNGPDHTVVSGPCSAIDTLLASAARAHVRARRVRTGCAFHSSRMDRALPSIERDAAATSFHEPATPLLSSVTADWLTLAALNDPSYWSGRVRAPIRFRDGIARLYAEGFRTFVEIGPHPMLLPIVRRDDAGLDSVCIETARRGEDDAAVTMAALARLPRAGASLAAYIPPARGRRSVDADARGRRRRAAEVSR